MPITLPNTWKNRLSRIFIELCAFSYSSSNSALYAVSVLQVIDLLVDSINDIRNDGIADDIQNVTCFVLIAQLFIVNYCSSKSVITELFTKDADNDEPSMPAVKPTLMLNATHHVKKFSSIGGTYVKTFSASASLTGLLLRFLPSAVSLAVGCTLAPFNAVTQFAIIGKQYSKDLLSNAAFSVIESASLSALGYSIMQVVDSNGSITMLVASVSTSLFIEMVSLTLSNKSCVNHLLAHLTSCYYSEQHRCLSRNSNSLLIGVKPNKHSSHHSTITSSLIAEAKTPPLYHSPV